MRKKWIWVLLLILLLFWDGIDRYLLIQKVNKLEDGICSAQVFYAYVDGIKDGLRFKKNHK